MDTKGISVPQDIETPVGVAGFPPAFQYIPPPPVGPDPVLTICPLCKSEIRTRVIHKATTKTHLMCLLLCCFMCWPCACLPYCMDSCRNATHYCPSCDTFIGTYES